MGASWIGQKLLARGGCSVAFSGPPCAEGRRRSQSCHLGMRHSLGTPPARPRGIGPTGFSVPLHLPLFQPAHLRTQHPVTARAKRTVTLGHRWAPRNCPPHPPRPGRLPAWLKQTLRCYHWGSSGFGQSPQRSEHCPAAGFKLSVATVTPRPQPQSRPHLPCPFARKTT